MDHHTASDTPHLSLPHSEEHPEDRSKEIQLECNQVNCHLHSLHSSS